VIGPHVEQADRDQLDGGDHLLSGGQPAGDHDDSADGDAS
jgi:hypothetical protein